MRQCNASTHLRVLNLHPRAAIIKVALPDRDGAEDSGNGAVLHVDACTPYIRMRSRTHMQWTQAFGSSEQRMYR